MSDINSSLLKRNTQSWSKELESLKKHFEESKLQLLKNKQHKLKESKTIILSLSIDLKNKVEIPRKN
jgi:hypothetical protein